MSSIFYMTLRKAYVYRLKVFKKRVLRRLKRWSDRKLEKSA
jgi:hypothetical protein